MKEYSFSPTRTGHRATVSSTILFALALVLFLASPLFSRPVIGQGGAVALLLLAIQITNRYLLSQPRYLFSQEKLFCFTVQGKRQKPMGCLELGEDCLLFSGREWNDRKKKFRLSHRLSLCANLSPKNPYYLLAPDGESHFVLLIFEPDDTLLSLLRQKIEPNESKRSPL